MGFLDALRGVNKIVPPAADSPEVEPLPEAPAEYSGYDQEQWHKKLKRVLGNLPETEAEWPDLEQEGNALGFPAEWLARTYREEFTLLVRQIVSDRVITSQEHHNLDTARKLLGIEDPEAEAILHAVVAEAEAFFGKPIDGA